MTAPLVIIGAGQAAAQAVTSLKAEGYGKPIIVIGDEPYLPYQRPPLSKAYLKREWTVDRLYLRPAEFWSGLGVDVVTGAPVTALDPAARTLEVGGRSVAWTKLALATGTRPRPLPRQACARRWWRRPRPRQPWCLRPHWPPGWTRRSGERGTRPGKPMGRTPRPRPGNWA